MDLPDAIDEVRPSVVQISYSVLDLPAERLAELGGRDVFSRPLGTGFFLSEEGLVVTAKHVVDSFEEVRRGFPDGRVLFGAGLAYPNDDNLRGNFAVMSFEIQIVDSLHDLAVLKVRPNPFREPLGGGIVIGETRLEPLFGVSPLDARRPRDGELVAISGYPLGEPALVTNAGTIASSWSVSVKDSDDPWASPIVQDVYLADVQSNRGNSGGPVYRVQDGAVIGILVAAKLTDVIAGDGPAAVEGVPIQADSGLSVVIPIKHALNLATG